MTAVILAVMVFAVAWASIEAVARLTARGSVPVRQFDNYRKARR